MWYGHNTHTYANPLGWPLGYPNRCMRKLSSLMTHSPYHSWHSRKLLRNATILNKLWKFCIILLDFIPLINISSWEVGNFEFPFGEWGTLFLNIDPNKKINILKFDGKPLKHTHNAIVIHVTIYQWKIIHNLSYFFNIVHDCYVFKHFYVLYLFFTLHLSTLRYNCKILS